MFCAALTFDDGYVEQIRHARLLYKMGVPGTFFLITGLKEYMGKKLMIARENLIRELVDMGHEIGSHTHTHRDLTRLSASEIERELKLSRSAVERLSGSGDIGVAYPYGSFNEHVIEAASKYFAYGRTMGAFNRWNEAALRYALGGMGARHLIKLPLRAVGGVRLVTVVFHDEPLWIVRAVIDYLRALGARFVTLREGLKCLGL